MKKSISLSSLATAKERLALLSEKPKEEVSPIEAVEMLRDTIQTLRSKNYTWDEIAAELAKADIVLSKYMLNRAIMKKRVKNKKEVKADQK